MTYFSTKFSFTLLGALVMFSNVAEPEPAGGGLRIRPRSKKVTKNN